ncbi:hypothetical protein [Actinomadura harenae]|uniref:Uncharacterized protein n=1 Tax=Actinomadura harenae TaxID=2483351 RepID=A0A3M2MDK3_9ACTN|nr:hypothetical protein [Actinomadura harenae]RMI47647.1 hypothetical protein EBO15_01750 [Actinomadura harenae]
MRLLSTAAVGAAIVGAGLLAPVSGEATAASRDVVFSPTVAQPGQHVRIDVLKCAVGKKRHWVGSKAFAKDATIYGKGSDGQAKVIVKRGLKSGSYKVTAHCGSRTLVSKLRVSNKPWPAVIPSPLTPGVR